jgi:hypothetical protein
VIYRVRVSVREVVKETVKAQEASVVVEKIQEAQEAQVAASVVTEEVEEVGMRRRRRGTSGARAQSELSQLRVEVTFLPLASTRSIRLAS